MTYTDGNFESWEGDELAGQVGDIVTARVERVQARGAYVRFEGGGRGYIRPRELTLSADADPRAVLTVGQTIRAMIVQPGVDGLLPELSLRRLETDPWPAFAARHRLGDVIAVTVKHVYADQLLVENQPGLDGRIPIDELQPGNPPDHPEALIKAGDRTQATIIYLDKTRKQLVLSVRRWIERLATADEIVDRLAGATAHVDIEPLAEAAALRLSVAPAEMGDVGRFLGETFRGIDPAATMVCTPLAHDEMKVEFEVTAYRRRDPDAPEKRLRIEIG